MALILWGRVCTIRRVALAIVGFFADLGRTCSAARERQTVTTTDRPGACTFGCIVHRSSVSLCPSTLEGHWAKFGDERRLRTRSARRQIVPSVAYAQRQALPVPAENVPVHYGLLLDTGLARSFGRSRCRRVMQVSDADRQNYSKNDSK